ncbi:DUF1878 family protein [Pseudomonas atacamensis]|uniref:DUF1878 family protein n=1 Tax=Pseudomonas atacamensis TaxID=2565368 RepID=UPI003C883C2F
MNLEDIMSDLEKIKYHIRILSDAIDYESHPVEALILSMDWGESDIDRAHDIFEKYDNMLNAKQAVNWMQFESDLKEEFNIGYQTVKRIVLAFFENHQWTDVCHGYAMSFEPTTPVEFHRITRR